MIETIFQVLGSALSIWDHKEKQKYIDQLIGLKRDWYEEFNKGAGNRSNAVLDNIKRELLNLAAAFTTSVGVKNPGA